MLEKYLQCCHKNTYYFYINLYIKKIGQPNYKVFLGLWYLVIINNNGDWATSFSHYTTVVYNSVQIKFTESKTPIIAHLCIL